MVIFAFPSLPLPVNVVRETLLNVVDPLAGVYPIPALVKVNAPVAVPAEPT